MRIEGQVGPQVVSDGAVITPRLSRDGSLVVAQSHGKYLESTVRGSLFVAANSAATTISTTGTTAGFTLANPLGSGKNLSVTRVALVIKALALTPVVGFYGLYVNSNPAAAVVTGTALTAQSALVGSGFAAAGKPLQTATLPATPTLHRLITQKFTGAATTLPLDEPYFIELDGELVLTPGTAVSLQQDAADSTNATAFCVMAWEEIPI